MKKKCVKELLWFINDPDYLDPKEKFLCSELNYFKHHVDETLE